MRIEVHHYHHLGDDGCLKLLLKKLFEQGERIMASQSQLTEQLNSVNTQLTKIGNETQTLLTKVDELNQAVINAANVSPELQAAADAVAAQAKVVDELVPDAT